MTPPGHLAFAYLMSRQGAPVIVRARLIACAMFGALIPDLVDKSLFLAGIYPWSRTVGHSAITWALLAAHVVIASVVFRTSPRLERHVAGVPWVTIGVLSHLLADLTDDMVAGLLHNSYMLTSWFLWPTANPDQWEWRVSPLLGPTVGLTFYEAAVMGLATALMFWDRRMLRGEMDAVEVTDDHPGQHAVPRGDD